MTSPSIDSSTTAYNHRINRGQGSILSYQRSGKDGHSSLNSSVTFNTVNSHRASSSSRSNFSKKSFLSLMNMFKRHKLNSSKV